MFIKKGKVFWLDAHQKKKAEYYETWRERVCCSQFNLAKLAWQSCYGLKFAEISTRFFRVRMLKGKLTGCIYFSIINYRYEFNTLFTLCLYKLSLSTGVLDKPLSTLDNPTVINSESERMKIHTWKIQILPFATLLSLNVCRLSNFACLHFEFYSWLDLMNIDNLFFVHLRKNF